MTDPRFLTLFSGIFILLGVYNVATGLRRIRDARMRNQRLVWYKQINLLTGTEYVLLALVFLLSVGSRNGTLPASLQGMVVPLYLILLISAAVLAGLVIRQGLSNARQLRAQSTSRTVQSNGATTRDERVKDTLDRQQRVANVERRRERRRNAAAARRRRTGKE